jgi:hypothetical protein
MSTSALSHAKGVPFLNDLLCHTPCTAWWPASFVTELVSRLCEQNLLWRIVTVESNFQKDWRVPLHGYQHGIRDETKPLNSLFVENNRP